MTTATIPCCGLPSADEIVGVSNWAREMRFEIRELAAHSLSVMIIGPTGTGKELIARAIHACSPRAAKPLIPVDCASLVGCLLPSHLFGHLKGAFTGAHEEAIGCFRAADGGTIFLDEIGELDVSMQANLLRVVQERSVIPVGGVRGTPVDVRIVAATNRDLKKEVDRGTFREDLYYRLNVGVLHTKPLAQRCEDVEVLAYHFLTDMAEQAGLPRKSLSRGAVDLLSAYHWPGNVRQLRNVLERSVVCAKGERINGDVIGRMLDVDPAPPQPGVDEGLLPDPIRLPADSCSGRAVSEARRQYPGCRTDPSRWLTLDNLERYHIQQTLVQAYYNQTAAAKMLDVTPRVLAGKIKKLGIDASASRPGRPKKISATGGSPSR